MSRCKKMLSHAILWEKTHPLKAPGSVAHFLRNSIFILINDSKAADVIDGAFIAIPCLHITRQEYVSTLQGLTQYFQGGLSYSGIQLTHILVLTQPC